MNQEELKAWIVEKERSTYSYLRMLARTESAEELKMNGFRSYEQALKITMKRSMEEIEKQVQKFEKENP